MNKTEIYSNKKKAILLFFLSIVFIVLGIWMILEAENIKTPFLRNPLLTRIIGISGILFFGFAMFVIAKQIFRNKLMLILDENGIHLKPPTNRIIKWKDITGFSEIKINSVKIIIIHVKNPEEYMNDETNKIRKKLMNYNLSNYGSPFTISVATMDITHKELWRLLNEGLKN
ncbi:hypothetical protein J2X31_003581 [Flavobacterium arsenatis]|uniref:Uncharacterized protein n=1 Tax=Flavobacterium arsenatis TaxID=1484332 RepID=A0ABU1TUI9_9FLAO|nr:STM3941 family protein [Flavobacterium arsenatis]MDR6969548.1 hypothetical protein [Flavobacterium arsenatis]